jgi:hypothetical protein
MVDGEIDTDEERKKVTAPKAVTFFICYIDCSPLTPLIE